MSRWEAVADWLDGLESHLGHVPLLSPAGARLGLESALQSIRIDAPEHLDGPVAAHTVFVASSTVFTVALEWVALLLARGGRVTVKVPRGLEAWYQAIANTELPLAVSTDRDVLQEADRVVLMGSDETVAAVQAALPHPERLLAFGSRHSLAWWTDPEQAAQVALDHVLYDGRGCMAPTGVFTALPDGADRLAAALQVLREGVPLGSLHDAEHAWARERRALARVVGRELGPYVLELPAGLWTPRAIPGVAQVYRADRLEDLPLEVDRISVLGTDREQVPGVRCEPLGRMQRPPLDRLHDGVRWVDAL